jgi:transcriptional regulator with XRE-family HTH domain
LNETHYNVNDFLFSRAEKSLPGISAVISGAQVRAARALLGWTAKDLAQKSKVGISTVQRIENAEGTPNVHAANFAAIESALEAAGIEFTNGDVPGIRLHRKPAVK